MSNQSQIRDPIHGVIYLSHEERALIESPAFQRLRNIKQLGFADFAFPGATHSRYSHSLGAMNFAGKMFDRVFAETKNKSELPRFRQAVRLAALLHDIGHPPLSHTTEMLMPPKNLLFEGASAERASHEDFTIKTIINSHLTESIEGKFPGVTASMVASLLSKNQESVFCIGALDYAPVLRQIISSEIDADRMDYLLRDSFFCGVNYGKFDSDWLIDNLIPIESEGKLYLGIKARAIFAFEDFLLSRYHMFASVYLHHTPVILEKMLARFFAECPNQFRLPSNIEDYLALDDMDLWWALRKSTNPWARRIVERKAYVLVSEHLSREPDDNSSLELDTLLKSLSDANIDTIASRSKSVLSHYFGAVSAPLFVKESHKEPVRLEEFSTLFIRYQVPAQIDRVFVEADDRERAQEIVRNVK
jgi:HD superfamily phosphohydrolase